MKSTWFCLALYGKIGCCDSTSIDGFEMILHCRFWLLIESLGRNIGPLFTTTTIAAAASALFLPYHLFIDSRLSQSITIFLVNKRNGVNESKELNNSYYAFIDPSVYEYLNAKKRNLQKAMCVLWYRILQNRGERWGDDSCSLVMRSNNEMVRNDWMWIFQIEHPLSVLKDGVSVILVLVTLVSRSK